MSAPLPDRWSALRGHEVPEEAIPEALGVLGRLQGELLSRLLASGNGKLGVQAKPEPDRLLDAAAAAKLLGVTRAWMYRHANKLPFTRRLSPKVLRLSEAGLWRYLAARRR